MPDPEPGPRLVDLYRAASDACRPILSARLEEVGMFGDLVWLPTGLPAGFHALIAHTSADPAFMVVGRSRYLAFQRLNGEIRYYAGPLEARTDHARYAENDPARLAEIAAEPFDDELGVVPTVADAVSLTDAYLSGTPLADIQVTRVVRGASRRSRG